MQCSVKNTFFTVEEQRPKILFRKSVSAINFPSDSMLTDEIEDISPSLTLRYMQRMESKNFHYSSPISCKVHPAPLVDCDSFAIDSETTSDSATRDSEEICDPQKSSVFIRNIPNRYTPEALIEEIHSTGFEVDFVHLPRAKKTLANLGYAFVNFKSSEAAQEFLSTFEGHEWTKQPNSKKRATLTWAKLQGFFRNYEFYSQKKIASKLARKPWNAYGL